MAVYLGAHNIISPLGFSSAENFVALQQGKKAVHAQKLAFSDANWCCAKISEEKVNQKFASLGNPNAYTHLEKMCILSISDTLQQSGKKLSDPESLLILSTTKGSVDVLENVYPNLSHNRAYLTELGRSLESYFACSNAPIILSNACISGVLALIIAQRYLESGTYKNIVVCGGDIVSEFTLSGFKSFNALSAEPSKPFDKNRVGINLGEAVASILVSTEKLSGIQLLGGSSANDANHISGPSRTGEGLFKAITETLSKTGIDKIDFISAHGTATEYNDEMESIAFTRAGLQQVPLHSLKGYYGHTLGTAGVLECIISILSLENNVLIASAGFEETGTSCPVNVIKETKAQTLQTCLKTASGFGGCNAAIVFRKNAN